MYGRLVFRGFLLLASTGSHRLRAGLRPSPASLVSRPAVDRPVPRTGRKQPAPAPGPAPHPTTCHIRPAARGREACREPGRVPPAATVPVTRRGRSNAVGLDGADGRQRFESPPHPRPWETDREADNESVDGELWRCRATRTDRPRSASGPEGRGLSGRGVQLWDRIRPRMCHQVTRLSHQSTGHYCLDVTEDARVPGAVREGMA